MQNAVVPISTLSSRVIEVRHTGEAANSSSRCALGERSDDEFVAMLDAYRSSGGLARAPEVIALFKRCQGPSVATLASWIAERDVICFEWDTQAWLPLFQFDRRLLRPDPQLQPVFAELTCVYDQWDIGAWFARPNRWLGDCTPVDVRVFDLPAVLHAARADRFVIQG